MSRQTEAKERQGYDPKPQAMVCGNCRHYSSSTVTVKGVFGEDHYLEKEKNCTKGQFSVKKTATCNLWSAK